MNCFYGISFFITSKRMNKLIKYIFMIGVSLWMYNNCIFSQGSFPPAVGMPGTTAVHKDSNIFMDWASQVHVTRGLQHYDSSSLGYTSSGTINDGLGVADGFTVSLGDSGVAVVSFNGSIYNGAGADFVVFENAFTSTFLELAYVEVSSDGINYVRFPNYYTANDTSQIGPFGHVDATHVHNLAGKYEVFYGTPFDLADIPDTSVLDKNNITHIKIIDVIGSLNHPQYDSEGRVINDPYPTAYPTGGFDLDAVGAINYNFIPADIEEENRSEITIYPNPTSGKINLQAEVDITQLELYNSNGTLLIYNQSNSMDLEGLNPGVYFLKVVTKKGTYVERIIKK